MTCARALAAGLAFAGLALPAAGGALEPRFDHRDQRGPALELSYSSDTVNVPGHASFSAAVPSLRLAWGFDVSGEGDELLTGLRVSWPQPDPEAQRIRVALDARYRAYFGTEEWKTFLDVGVFASLASRVAVGPLVGLGLAYDWSRAGGVYAAASLATGFGEARLATLALAAGLQLRFE